MIAPILMGLAAGARSLAPLAIVSQAAARGALSSDNGAPDWLRRPKVVSALKALTALELLGDKLPFAPDRIAAPGLAARIFSASIAGAALSPRRRARVGAAAGAAATVGAAYLTFHLRRSASQRLGQTPSGVLEDVWAIGLAWAGLRAGIRDAAQSRGG